MHQVPRAGVRLYDKLALEGVLVADLSRRAGVGDGLHAGLAGGLVDRQQGDQDEEKGSLHRACSATVRKVSVFDKSRNEDEDFGAQTCLFNPFVDPPTCKVATQHMSRCLAWHLH